MRVVLLIITMLISSSVMRGEEYPLSDARRGVRTSTDVLAIALPVATITGVLIEKDWQGLKQGALTAVTAVGANMILKYSVHKLRPDGSNYHSFPSMHTTDVFASAAFLQRRYGWKFGAPAYAVACYVGWGRTFAKKHDWWDVLAGAAIGAGSAYIYTRPWARDHSLSICPASDGHTFGFTASVTF